MSENLQANDCLEICESRVRLGFFLAGGLLLTLGALFMSGACVGVLLGLLGPPPRTAGQIVSPILALLIGLAGIIMFGSATIQSATRLFNSRQPVLFLGPDGFKDIRICNDWIPWSAILSAKDYRGKGVVLDVDPRFASKLRLGFVTRFIRSANRLFGYRGLWIAAFPLENTSSRALLAIMRGQIERRQSAD
jgi:hypothetical protein